MGAGWSFEAFFTQIIESTWKKLASFGLQKDEGVIHETS
jgi:hypothetical protein